MYYLEKVKFTLPFGEDVSFDDQGNVLTFVDIVNSAMLPNGSMIQNQNVGVFKGEGLILYEDRIIWNPECSKVALPF